jgi:hypothetical protein
MPEAVRQHRALARAPDEAHPSPQPCTPNLHLTTSETAALSVHSWPVTDPRENGRPQARLPDRDRDPTALVSVPDNSVRFDDVVERVDRTHDR